MSNEAMPFEEATPRTFAPLGTAPGVRSAPALESLELEEDIPVAANPFEIDRRATRYVVFVGDMIPPAQKRSNQGLRIGGEYLGQQFKTLIRTKGLLRRCQITPMEVGFDFISDEMLGENGTGLQIVGTVTHGPSAINNGFTGSRKLNAVEIFPGDEIKGLMRLNYDASHGQRGYVELTGLQGLQYADVKKAGIQQFVIPEWEAIVAGSSTASFPETLREIVEGLEKQRASTSDQSLKDIVDTYLLSAEQFRNWGVSYLKVAAQLVKVPAHQGFIHTFSPFAEMLLKYLEIVPTDDILRNPTQVGSAHSENSAAEMRELLSRMVAVQESMAQAGQGTGAGVEVTPAVSSSSSGLPVEAPTPVHSDASPSSVINPEALAANPTPPAVAPAEKDAVVRCSAISTTTGEQCKREAVANGRCQHPAHVIDDVFSE